MTDCRGTQLFKATAIGIVFSLLLLASARAASDSAEPPQLRVFFDAEATTTIFVCPACVSRSITAYVVATGSEQPVGGAAYRLSHNPFLELTGATYPPGSQVGDPLTGVEVSLSGCSGGSGAGPVLVSTLTLLTSPDLIWSTAGIGVEPHPAAGAVLLRDCGGLPQEAGGGWAYITYVSAADERTWGTVKSLYSR